MSIRHIFKSLIQSKFISFRFKVFYEVGMNTLPMSYPSLGGRQPFISQGPSFINKIFRGPQLFYLNYKNNSKNTI